ncbi:MAG: alpha/beta fold hydrolase [Salinisphaeraceae bacterium]|nr:alpha/beta fold hydrolase [Salinisphaeraceae bacterium]
MTAAAQALMSVPDIKRQVLRYELGFGIENDAAACIEAELYRPDTVSETAVFFCLPGGAMNRRFFDLGGDAGDSRFSFARQMAARGFVTVLIDPPGVGGSDRPTDGHDLTPERIADILNRFASRAIDDIRQGRIEGMDAMPDMVPLGLGHSMGAMLTVLQQAAQPDYAAIALLGFGTQGLPQFLTQEAKALVDKPEAWRASLSALAKKAFPQAYPVLASDGGEAGLFGSTHADPEAVKMLKAANDVMLPVTAFMSLFPGNVAPEAAQIEAPVYLALGERDLIRDPEAVPENFPASIDVRLQILPQTGHSHFLFPSREQLFDGLAHWARQLTEIN